LLAYLGIVKWYNMNFSNTKLVTHKNCWDGSASAILFMAVGGRRENILFSNPDHESVDEIAKDLYYGWSDEILFVDVSVSEEMADLLRTRSNILLFDHHKSAIPLAKHKFCTIDKNNDNCGSKLLYNWLLSLGFDTIKVYKDFIDGVDDVDRWQHNIPYSKDVGALHGILGVNLFIDRFMKNTSVSLTNEEKFTINLDNVKYEDFLQEKKNAVVVRDKKIDDVNYRIGFVYAGGAYRSRLGNDLCKDQMLNLDAIVMISNDYVSFRSVGKVDVSRVAEIYSGGGHKSAAGCCTSNIIGKSLLNMVADKIEMQ
jgi:oligoribonuclease NrnB/cAMP/cGMP phosphodiesterase (DHH superfamily)